jgi:hypothetical protein
VPLQGHCPGAAALLWPPAPRGLWGLPLAHALMHSSKFIQMTLVLGLACKNVRARQRP